VLHVVVVLLQTAVDTVSSHKFLPLIYQLAARMSQSITGFQTVLHQVCIIVMHTQRTHVRCIMMYIVSCCLCMSSLWLVEWDRRWDWCWWLAKVKVSGFIWCCFCSTSHSRHSGMDHTVLPANYTIPESTS